MAKTFKEYQKIYQYTMLSEEEMYKFYEQAISSKSTDVDTAFSHLITEYLKKNITIDIMKNFIKQREDLLNRGNKRQDAIFRSFFKFLYTIHYTLTLQDASELIKIPIFQNLLSKKFPSKKAVPYATLEEFTNDDENFITLCFAYFEENDIQIVSLMGDDQDNVIGQNNKNKILTYKEEIDLIIQANTGNMEARNKLIEHNINLVKSIAKRYTGRGLEFEELVSEGTFGIVEAINKFDRLKGTTFSTYATYWIRQSITRALDSQVRTIRLPIYTVDAIRKIARIQEELTAKLNRKPTIEEIALEADLNVEHVKNALSGEKVQPVSLDKKIGDEDDRDLNEKVPDEKTNFDDILNKHLANEILEKAEETLDERAYMILKYRMGFINNRVYTLKEVGEIFHLTRERVRQIEKESIQVLKRKKSFKKESIEKVEVTYNTFDMHTIHVDLTKSIFFPLLQLLPEEDKKWYIKYRGIDVKYEYFRPVKEQEYSANFLNYMRIIESDLLTMYMLFEKLNKKNMLEEDIYKRIQKYMILHSIRFRFSDHSLKEIKEAVSKLTKNQQEIIYLRYGKNLLSFHLFPKGKSYSNIYKILNRLEDILLNKGKEDPNNKKEIIYQIEHDPLVYLVSLLPIDYQELMFLCHGDNLDQDLSYPKPPKGKARNYYHNKYVRVTNKLMLMYAELKDKYSVDTIKNIRNENIVLTSVKRKPRSILDVETKENVFFAMQFLSEKQKAVLILHHGENLDQDLPYPQPPEGKNKNYYQKTYYNIFIRVQYILENKEEFEKLSMQKRVRRSNIPKEVRKTKRCILYQIEHETLVYLVSLLPTHLQEVMFLRHGDNLDQMLPWPKSPEGKGDRYYMSIYGMTVKKLKMMYKEYNNEASKEKIRTDLPVGEIRITEGKNITTIQKQREKLENERKILLLNKEQHIVEELYQKYVMFTKFIFEETLRAMIQKLFFEYVNSVDHNGLEIACNMKIESEILLKLSSIYNKMEDNEESLEILFMLDGIYGERLRKRFTNTRDEKYPFCYLTNGQISDVIENTIRNYDGRLPFYTELSLVLKRTMDKD